MATATKERAATPPGANADDRRFIERYASGLSKSAMRAKWTHRPGDAPDRRGQTLATRAHEVIQAWAKERDAVPAAATRGPDGRPRTLRLDFNASADAGGGRLERISWDEWFAVFDDRKLLFLYQEQKRDGAQSNFFRLDNPTREDG